MAHQPVFLLHIGTGFNIKIAAARQCCHEQTRFVLLAGDRVVIRDSAASPVHLHCVPGFVRNTHRCFRNTSPAAVFVTKLRAHVRLFTARVGTLTILVPEQSEGDAFL